VKRFHYSWFCVLTAKMASRTIDKSALAKTFGVLLMSILFIVTYSADLMLCTDIDELSGYTTASDNTCKMSLYTVMFADDTHGDVYVIYYLLVWILILTLSLFGFVLLLCNCNMLCRRIYSILLVAAAACLSIAEFISMADTKALAEAQITEWNWDYYATTFGGLNACVWILECYILVNTAFDAWTEE